MRGLDAVQYGIAETSSEHDRDSEAKSRDGLKWDYLCPMRPAYARSQPVCTSRFLIKASSYSGRAQNVLGSSEGGPVLALLSTWYNGRKRALIPLEVFLETEATLPRDVVVFVGLGEMERICDHFNIKTMEQDRSGGAVIRGSFQAVDDVHGYLTKLVCKGTSSTAFGLAFLSHLHTTPETNSTTESKEDPATLRPERLTFRTESARSQQEQGVTRGQTYLTQSSSHSKYGEKLNSEVAMGLGQQELTHQFEILKVIWQVVELTADVKTRNIEKDSQVKIRTRAAVDANKLIVSIVGQTQTNLDDAIATLSEIVQNTEKDLDNACVPLVECADTSWLKEVNWNELRIVYALEDGNKCLLTGLQEDVKKAKRKIKRMEDSHKTTVVSTSAVVRCFCPLPGRQIVVKQGDITAERVDVLVTATNSELISGSGVPAGEASAVGSSVPVECSPSTGNKRKHVEGDAFCTAPGALPCRVLVHAITPACTSSSSNSGNLERILKTACYNSLMWADEKKGTTVAFPLLGRELRDIPNNVCARSMLDATDSFFKIKSQTTVAQVRFVDVRIETVDTITREAQKRYSSRSRSGRHAHQSPVQLDRKPGWPVRKNDGELAGQACAKCQTVTGHKTILQCGHFICQSCSNPSIRQQAWCSVCMRTQNGNQPEGGSMEVNVQEGSLPGYNGVGIIVIRYDIPSGQQGPNHPSPGQSYEGTTEVAYLPNNAEGRQLRELLKKAFQCRLIFTVGRSAKTGKDNVVWNGISHKTSISGQRHGYPDPGYFQRLRQELKEKGIE